MPSEILKENQLAPDKIRISAKHDEDPAEEAEDKRYELNAEAKNGERVETAVMPSSAISQPNDNRPILAKPLHAEKEQMETVFSHGLLTSANEKCPALAIDLQEGEKQDAPKESAPLAVRGEEAVSSIDGPPSGSNNAFEMKRCVAKEVTVSIELKPP